MLSLSLLLRQCEDLLLNEGKDDMLDKRRVILIINLLTIRLSPIIPIVLSIADNLPSALEMMTCHILGVRAVSNDIRKTIVDLNKKIRGLLGDEILSSSVSKSMIIVSDNVTLYMKWLRTHQVTL